MDPASALGIAAAVVQFVDFATKRCRDVLKMYETGDTTFFRGAVFEHTARDFLDFSADLRETQNMGSITHVGHKMADDVRMKFIMRIHATDTHIFRPSNSLLPVAPAWHTKLPQFFRNWMD
jgi:hypothetical protein